MSFQFYESLDTHLNSGNFRKSENKSEYSGWLPYRHSLKWDPLISRRLWKFFKTLSPPFRLAGLPSDLPSDVKSEVRKFLISLDGYVESFKPVMPYKEILYGATQIDYAERLKKIRRRSFIESWGADLFDLPDDWEETPFYIISDIGQIFNYSYLIFWEREDPKDYLYGFIPVKIKEKSLLEFKEAVLAILPDKEIEKVDKREILLTISSSKSLTKDFKSKEHFLIKGQHLTFSQARGVSKRSVINVSPENIRDTVILNPSDLNTISLIDQQVMKILEKTSGHIHLSNEQEILRRISKFQRKCNYFLHRDIKKEGITKPRELLRVMLEAICEKYPYLELEEFIHFYDGYSVLVEKDIVYPLRGHGLGMANSLTTIMQLAINQMILDLNGRYDDIILGRSKTLYLNDDSVVGFESEDDLDAYWNLEDRVLSKLSIIREPKKSFTSRNFVIAERYYSPNPHKKESYMRRECLLPLCAFNVMQAKEMFISNQEFITNDIIRIYGQEIIDLWGYEFCPEEVTYPSEIGGWINEKVFGVSNCFRRLEKMPYSAKMMKCFYASQLKKIRIPIKFKSFILPFNKLFPGDIPEEYEKFLCSDPRRVFYDFQSLQKANTKAIKVYLDKLQQKRQQKYREHLYIPSFENFIIEVKNFYKGKDFLPPTDFICRKGEFNLVSGKVNDFYTDPNPKLSLLCKLDRVDYPFSESWSSHMKKNKHIGIKHTHEFMQEVHKVTKNITLKIDYIPILKEISDEQRFQESYNDPIAAACAEHYLDPFLDIPIPNRDWRNPLLEEKEAIFGRLLSFSEILYLSRIQPSRESIKRLIALSDDSLESSFERVRELLKTVEPEPEEVEYLSEEEDESLQLYKIPFLSPYRTTEEEVIIRFQDFFKEDIIFLVTKGYPVVEMDPRGVTEALVLSIIKYLGNLKIRSDLMGLSFSLTEEAILSEMGERTPCIREFDIPRKVKEYLLSTDREEDFEYPDLDDLGF